MPTYRDDAIVLRTHLLGESDKIVTLLGRSRGKIRAVAKGIRKTSSRFGARLEPFNQVDALVWSLIMGVAWGVVVAVSPWQTSRYLMARSEHVVLRSACGASLAVFLVYLAIYFGAAAINLSKPDIEPPESAMLWVAMNLMPTVAGAMMVSGILAAGLSSASTFLSLTGFSASNDIFRHSLDPQRQLRSTRYTMIGISAIVLVLALVPVRGSCDLGFARLRPHSSWRWISGSSAPLPVGECLRPPAR